MLFDDAGPRRAVVGGRSPASVNAPDRRSWRAGIRARRERRALAHETRALAVCERAGRARAKIDPAPSVFAEPPKEREGEQADPRAEVRRHADNRELFKAEGIGGLTPALVGVAPREE